MSERRDAYTTATPENVCVRCGYQQDSASDFLRKATPKAGDVSLCMKCGHVAIFTEALTLREPTEEEGAEIRRIPFVQEAQQGIWEMHERGLWKTTERHRRHTSPDGAEPKS
jgi:hypothetical protein